MAEQEYHGFLTNIRADGEQEILLPITDRACVRGMEEVDAHVASRENPHGVTAAQIGAEKAGAVGAHAASSDAHRALFDAKADKKVSKDVANALGLDPETATVDDALRAAGKQIILDIRFLSAHVGKQYRITGPGLSAPVSGTVPAGKRVMVGVHQNGSRYTLTCGGITIGMDVLEYYGVYRFVLAPPLSEADPATIGEVAAAGLAKVAWKVGDEVNLTLSDGEVLSLQIYDFDHDTLVSGGVAPITFGLLRRMEQNECMNASNTNSGGWPESVMYSHLNTTVYPKIPQAWKNILKPVKKLTAEKRNGSMVIKASNDNLFLFAEEEVFGSSGLANGEGKLYPIFLNAGFRLKSGSDWWLRTPSENTSSFRAVTKEGMPANRGASYANGVCFGFCV